MARPVPVLSGWTVGRCSSSALSPGRSGEEIVREPLLPFGVGLEALNQQVLERAVVRLDSNARAAAEGLLDAGHDLTRALVPQAGALRACEVVEAQGLLEGLVSWRLRLPRDGRPTHWLGRNVRVTLSRGCTAVSPVKEFQSTRTPGSTRTALPTAMRSCSQAPTCVLMTCESIGPLE